MWPPDAYVLPLVFFKGKTLTFLIKTTTSSQCHCFDPSPYQSQTKVKVVYMLGNCLASGFQAGDGTRAVRLLGGRDFECP